MISSTTVVVLFGSLISDTGFLLGLVLGVVVSALIALMGVGFGIRYIKRWIFAGKDYADFKRDSDYRDRFNDKFN
jgi:O-antigen/teichoic acid export membrane protein